MWAAAPQCILLLGTNGHSPALLRAGPINRHYCPLSSEVSRYAGLYLVSVASLPHHLQATHLVFRPTLAEPKHFLLVTQPPRRAEGRESESRRGEGGGAVSESGSQPRNEHITASFPLSLHAQLQSGVIHPLPVQRESFCQGSASHAILVPHPTAH